jgi:predicted nucleic acid-binding protein
MNTRVVVDTSVWIDFFNQPHSSVTLHLQNLLRNRQVVLVGMVLTEILQGIKNPEEARRVRESLEPLPFLETTLEKWQKAGELSAQLRRKGLTLPLSDLIIAATALHEEVAVFTLDPHFKKVPNLKLHVPPKAV